MLTHIQIRDFAIIDAVELELGAGLTVLTGETGAGKSILVDALLLAVGGKGGAEVVRHGSERAEVTATFSLAHNPRAHAWFEEQSIEHEGECVLRRMVAADGRSRAYVNSVAMPVQALRQLGETLVDVHGQMEYQSLMKRSAQRDLLDRQGGHAQVLDAVAASWGIVKELRSKRDATQASAKDRTAKLELLRYHVGELDALDLKEGEAAELIAERTRVAQRSRLAQGSREIAELLRDAETGNAEQALARALQLARNLAALDRELTATAQLIDESLIALKEAANAIDHYESGLDADPARQEWLEQRLAALENLARKHRVEVNELPALRERLRTELTRLETLEITLEDIESKLRAAQARFTEDCTQLSRARQLAQHTLVERVTTLMQGLGMPGGRFDIELRSLGEDEASEHGSDQVEFLVSANPGQPLRPLAKVASGGELSRISLAIQVAAVESAQQPCLVFDEVDTGVGGAVAEIVGRQLRELGEHTQVLCVTHLPQVAGQAHAHVRVSKLTDGTTTRTHLHPLTHDERIEEIARMLGGVKISDKAREHAAEMLRVGKTTRTSPSAKTARRGRR
jgi:DNA repair protein RecN (Recombination protein N)